MCTFKNNLKFVQDNLIKPFIIIQTNQLKLKAIPNQKIKFLFIETAVIFQKHYANSNVQSTHQIIAIGYMLCLFYHVQSNLIGNDFAL